MDDNFILVVWIGGGILFSILGWMIGDSRGRPGAGFLCGFLLGPLGCVIALFLPKETAAGPARRRRPGQPTARERRMPVKADPLEEWEAREKAKAGPPPPPEGFR